jgi:hypothetical protein
MQTQCVSQNSLKEREYESFELGLEQVINETHDHVKLHKPRKETNIV